MVRLDWGEFCWEPFGLVTDFFVFFELDFLMIFFQWKLWVRVCNINVTLFFLTSP